MDPRGQIGAAVPNVKLDTPAPSSVLREMFGGWLDFSPVKRGDSEALLKELARRQEEAAYELTPKEARVVANLQTTMSNMGNVFFLVGLVGTALLTRSRPKSNRWIRWPLCFSVALLGQEHANNTAPFAVIGSLATMDSPVGGEVRELARERLSAAAAKLVLSQERQHHEPGSPSLRIMMDPAERAHLQTIMTQRAESARTQRQAPGRPGLPEMSPTNQRPLPRQQGSLWEQTSRKRSPDASADDTMQDAFSAESDAMFKEQPSVSSSSGSPRSQEQSMGDTAGDVFPSDGDAWLSGEPGDSDGEEGPTRRQRRVERRRERQSSQGSGGGESLEGYFDDRWENPSSRPR